MNKLSKLVILTGLSLSIIRAHSQTPVRKVLLEEFTTASCGNCPPASQNLSNWQAANSAHCILMTIHEGSGTDAMSNTLTNAIFSAMHPTGFWFAPAAMIDRGVYPSTNGEAYLAFNSTPFGSGTGVDTIAMRLITEPAIVGVDISGTYNSATRTINATVNANFVQPVASGDWRINLFLVEDSVIGYPNLGPFQGWDQECYNTTWANTYYPGMFNGTFIIGYPHRHVMRSSFFGNWGIGSVIPSVPVVGTNYSATTSLVVDTAYHDNHLSLVAFVSSYGTLKTQKFVLNANSIEVSNNFATGISQPETTANDLMINNLFPQPSTGNTQLVFTLNRPGDITIDIIDISGKRIQQQSLKNNSKGKHEMILDTRNFSKGIYQVVLKSGMNSIVKKLVVE